MILFFDTETTGIPDRRMPIEWPGQPHIVQLAALLMDSDGVEHACLSVIIEPDGWMIPATAAKVHGITTEIAAQRGVPLAVALNTFIALRRRAQTIAAHNIMFDAEIMRIGMARVGIDNRAEASVSPFCTCESASPIVNLPPTDRMRAAGYNKPKPPNLGECIRFFFNEELTGAHDALVDVRACARIYFEIQRRHALTA